MNKEELIYRLSQHLNISVQESSSFVKILFETMNEALQKGKCVNIEGFGKFKPINRNGKLHKISFSPVNKFASRVNSQFNNLTSVPVALISQAEATILSEDEYNFTEDEQTAEEINKELQAEETFIPEDEYSFKDDEKPAEETAYGLNNEKLNESQSNEEIDSEINQNKSDDNQSSEELSNSTDIILAPDLQNDTGTIEISDETAAELEEERRKLWEEFNKDKDAELKESLPEINEQVEENNPAEDNEINVPDNIEEDKDHHDNNLEVVEEKEIEKDTNENALIDSVSDKLTESEDINIPDFNFQQIFKDGSDEHEIADEEENFSSGFPPVIIPEEIKELHEEIEHGSIDDKSELASDFNDEHKSYDDIFENSEKEAALESNAISNSQSSPLQTADVKAPVMKIRHSRYTFPEKKKESNKKGILIIAAILAVSILGIWYLLTKMNEVRNNFEQSSANTADSVKQSTNTASVPKRTDSVESNNPPLNSSTEEEQIFDPLRNIVFVKAADGFYIQTGSYKEENIAEQKAAGFKSQGFTSLVTEVSIEGKGKYYRVRVGKFATLDEAKNTADKLK